MATTAWQTLDSPVEFDLNGTLAGYWAAALRIVTGYWFLHAGVDKLAFVAGEPFDAAGWLLTGTGGSPIHGFFAWVAGSPWLLEFTNVMVPAGEILIGLGLVVGGFVRLAAFFGGVLMTLFYLGNAAWSNGFVNSDLLGLLLFVTVGVLGAGRVIGIDALLEQTDLGSTRAAKFLLG